MRKTAITVVAIVAVACVLAGVRPTAQVPIAAPNVSMISGLDDPNLQRQNEVSVAVSTRNPCHLMGGANDYRTLDILDARPLPGQEATPVIPTTTTPEPPARDTWVGAYTSTTCGATWDSALVPGHAQDTSPEGDAAVNPLRRFALADPDDPVIAAADPVVRAGVSGMFYYGGMVFSRNKQRSMIFLARYIDNNNKERGNPIEFIDVSSVATSKPGEFLDKPWLAVSLPWQYSAGHDDDGEGDHDNDDHGFKPSTFTVKGQQIPTSYVYMAWASFTGGDSPSRRARIMFARSTDGGVTWSTPRALSDGKGIAQGATIAIAPDRKTVYVAWREFAINGRPNAIYITRSPDGGAEFFKPKAIATISPFDQPRERGFRTNSLPTMTASPGGRIYVAWAARGFAAVDPNPATGPARIVMAVSSDHGRSFGPARRVDHDDNDAHEQARRRSGTPPFPVDDHSAHPGHQLMPSLWYGGGKLNLVYYDARDDRAPAPADPYISGIDHSIDVRGAQAAPGSTPTFVSFPISQYRSITENGVTLREENRPNLFMYELGQRTFIGDYTDNSGLAAIPVRLPFGQQIWVPNVSRSEIVSSVQPEFAPLVNAILDRTIGHLPQAVFQVSWTDNRNAAVVVPGTTYFPPGSPYFASNVCDPNLASMLNANPYFSRVVPEIFLASAQNTKPLGFVVRNGTRQHIQRTFVIFVQNHSTETRYGRLVIANQPGHLFGDRASFDQFPAPPFMPGTSLPPPVIERDVTLAGQSTYTETVYVTAANERAPVRIDLLELNTPVEGQERTVKSGGFRHSVQLNPDASNPPVENPDDVGEVPSIAEEETHHPVIFQPVAPPAEVATSTDFDIANPLGSRSLSVEEQPREGNPREGSPREGSPREGSPREGSSAFENTAIGDLTDGAGNPRFMVRDYQFKLANTSNTSGKYVFTPVVPQVIPGAHYQLLITQRYYQPTVNIGSNTPDPTDDCALVVNHQNRVIVNMSGFVPQTPREGSPREGSPREGSPREGSPREGSPREGSATFLMAPGETMTATLRVFEPIGEGAANLNAGARRDGATRMARAARRVEAQPAEPAQPPAPGEGPDVLLTAPGRSEGLATYRRFLPPELRGSAAAFAQAPDPEEEIPEELRVETVRAELAAESVDTRKAEAGITEPERVAAGPDLLIVDNRRDVPAPPVPTPSLSTFNVTPGGTLTVNWILRNGGTDPAPAPFINAIWVSPPDATDPTMPTADLGDDLLLFQDDAETELAAGAELPRMQMVTMPGTLVPGGYVMMVVTDECVERIEGGACGHPQVDEANNANNVAFVPVTVVPFALAFAVQPSTTTQDFSITPPVQVLVRHSDGSPVAATLVPNVSLAIGANPGAGTLAGTTTRANLNGVASFDDITINNAAAGYTLVASAPRATPVTSTPFTVEPDDPPQAQPDNYVVNEDQMLATGEGRPGVLANDTDEIRQGPGTPPAGRQLTIVEPQGITATNGALTLLADGNFTYLPEPNFNGIGTFRYQLNDGRSTSTLADVLITVLSVNDAPSFTRGPDQLLPEEAAPQTIENWATNISPGPANEANQTLEFLVTNDNNGLFEVQPAIAPDGTLTYTPAEGARGQALVTVRLRDNGGTENGGIDTSPPQTFSIGVVSDRAIVVSFSSNNVRVLDIAARAIQSTLPVGTFNDVIDVAVTPDGRTALVTRFGARQVSFLDLTTTPPTVTGSIAAPINAEDVHVAISPTGYAVVADGGSSTMVFSIDIANQRVVSQLQLPAGVTGEGITVMPDRGIVLVNSFSGGVVRVLNLAADGTLTDTGVSVTTGGSGPINVEPSPDGTLALVANFDNTIGVGVLSVAANGTVSRTATLALGTSFGFPQSITFRADGRRAYVLSSSGRVAVLNIDAGTVTDSGIRIEPPGGNRVVTGFFGVDQIAMSGRWILVHLTGASGSNGAVVIIDSTTNTVVGNIDLPAPDGGGGIAAIP